MSKLVIDARLLSTGIGTYTYNIISRLKACGSIHLCALTLAEHASRLRPYCDEVSVVKSNIYSVREQCEIPWQARGCDVLHVPHYNIPLFHRGVLLVSIHDLTHILDATFRRGIKSRLYAQPMFRLAASKAAQIFTVSEYSKQQIMEHLKVPEEKITVAYNGVSRQFFPEPHDQARDAINRQLGFNGPYVLYVGNLKPHKNVSGLIRAFAAIRSRRKLDHKLLIIGDDAAGRPEMIKLAQAHKLNGASVFARGISSSLLRTAYSGADLTVLPSFEEGFGLPIIESMACGTPVACSSAACMPEVGGEAAEYFDPRDMESISDAVERVLLSEDRRREMQILGVKQARRFRWEDSAQLHFSVYQTYL